MAFQHRFAPRVLLPLTAVALPVVLLYSSIRTLRELDEQRTVYLRHRVSILVSRLETFDASLDPGTLRARLAEQEPYLADLTVIAPNDPAARNLTSIWNGQELFRTELTSGTFRAHVPFHSAGGLWIARIDIDPAAADFLLLHARHNVIVASVSGLVLVLLSIYTLFTMRRAARMELRQLEWEHLAHIGKMSAVLAHEIRNPLGTIKGFVQLAAERSDQAAREMLDRALAETQRLEHLVKDLLSYGRPAVPEWKPVEWQALAAVVEAHGRQLIGSRPIRLWVNTEPVTWRSDPALLEQALLNLLRNGVEAIPPGSAGEIRVAAAREASGEIVIRVSDTGNGIPEAVRQRLFEPFLTTKASGTGLGLPITRKLAESLWGKLELRPGELEGTEAILRFPAIGG